MLSQHVCDDMHCKTLLSVIIWNKAHWNTWPNNDEMPQCTRCLIIQKHRSAPQMQIFCIWDFYWIWEIKGCRFSTFMGCGWPTAEAQVGNMGDNSLLDSIRNLLLPSCVNFSTFLFHCFGHGANCTDEEMEIKTISRPEHNKSTMLCKTISLKTGAVESECGVDLYVHIYSIIHASICMHAYFIHTLLHEFTLPFTTIL